jgi:hypothetical protein
MKKPTISTGVSEAMASMVSLSESNDKPVEGNYYSTPFSEGVETISMDKHHLVNAFKKTLKIETHENNIEFVNHNLKVLEQEIINRLSKLN